MDGERREGAPQADLRSITRIVLRPYGSALPLGFFGFGMGIAIITAFGYGLIPPEDQRAAGIMMLAFAVPLEGLAAVFALLSRDAAAASAMGMFTASWTVNGITFLTSPAIRPDPAIGVFTSMLTLFLIGLTLISFRGKPMLGVFLVLAVVRMAAYAGQQFQGGPAYGQIANACGALLVVASLYGGFAFLLEDIQHREVLPVFRRGDAKQAMEGGLESQLAEVDTEAGVRQQL